LEGETLDSGLDAHLLLDPDEEGRGEPQGDVGWSFDGCDFVLPALIGLRGAPLTCPLLLNFESCFCDTSFESKASILKDILEVPSVEISKIIKHTVKTNTEIYDCIFTLDKFSESSPLRITNILQFFRESYKVAFF
jgi:hypothetical protein